MRRHLRCCCLGFLLAGCVAWPACAQQALTWQEIHDRFKLNNPALQAGKIGIDESHATEVTAFLRPNPSATFTADQLDPLTPSPYRPLANSLIALQLQYLHERQHKRELRRESAQESTAITVSAQADLERILLFALRGAFIQTLQSKAMLGLARQNLDYYDKVIAVNRDRFKSGDIAAVDFERIELQRAQFQSDLVTAQVNLRSAKIALLTLLNDRTPVAGFDVTGTFDFSDFISPLDDFRKIALDTRPDLKAAVEAIEKARTDHQLAVADGSSDPIFSVDAGRNPPLDHYVGFGVNIPLRIFDRNQGEKLRTQLEVGRDERLRTAAEAGVLSDVDSSYEQLNGVLDQLRPYKAEYLKQAADVRDTVSFAYNRGAVSLLDFLDAQKSYRDTRLTYVNLVAAYLAAVNQLNFSVGREVIP